MTEDENFISRWSRRKHRAAREAQGARPAPATGSSATGVEDVNVEDVNEAVSARANSPEPEASAKGPELAFDPASLPSIESITAESDIRPFLAPGVPPELSRAALRRVWTTDPAIRDFVGLSENAWDFNAPDSIAGFGRLEMTDELRRQVARIVVGSCSPDEKGASTSAPPAGQSAQATSELPSESAATPQGSDSGAEAMQPGFPRESVDQPKAQPAIGHGAVEAVAAQQGPPEPENVRVAAKPAHGRALPK
jgi:hypothetical protein